MLLRFSPLILALIYGFLWWQFSAWNTKRRLKSDSKPLRDPSLQQDVERLAKVLDVPELPVRILEERAINALAGPDGNVYLTRGMYDLYVRGTFTQPEIMGVICHEVGHLMLRHTQRRMLDFTAQNALRTGLAMLLSRIIPFGGQLAALLMRLVAARLSRNDEFEADNYGTSLMKTLGHGSAPMTSMLNKVELLGPSGRPPAWLASHPETAKRIEAIKATHGT